MENVENLCVLWDGQNCQYENFLCRGECSLLSILTACDFVVE